MVLDQHFQKFTTRPLIALETCGFHWIIPWLIFCEITWTKKLQHLQLTFSETRLLTAGGTSLLAMHMYAPIILRVTWYRRSTSPWNDSTSRDLPACTVDAGVIGGGACCTAAEWNASVVATRGVKSLPTGGVEPSNNFIFLPNEFSNQIKFLTLWRLVLGHVMSRSRWFVQDDPLAVFPSPGDFGLRFALSLAHQRGTFTFVDGHIAGAALVHYVGRHLN